MRMRAIANALRPRKSKQVMPRLREDIAERTVEVPQDLAKALTAGALLASFDAMSFTHRKEWIKAVLDAKRPETRAKRIAACIAALHR
jgi:uncharacterized protein YdeI (YjbR/CyaY-like superfamily)